MSQLCAVTKCNRASRWLCDCCQQNLCLQHLNEHNASLISQRNPLTDEINVLGDRLRTLNMENIVGQELDRLVEEKVKKQQQELVRLQSRVAELMREQETTRQNIDGLASSAHHLKLQMDEMEHACFGISTRPLIIGDSYIRVGELNEVDLSTLSPVCKTIRCPIGSRLVTTSNDRFLLMHRNRN